MVIYDTVGPCGNAARSVFCVCLDFIDRGCDGELQSGLFVKAGCRCLDSSEVKRFPEVLQALCPY